MKLYRNAIILVVVLVLLVGAYYFINNKKTTTPDVATVTTDTNVNNLISVDQTKITSLGFSNEKGSFTLDKVDNAWTMNPTIEIPIDNAIADTAATNMSAISAEKVIEEKATDLAKYGLDKPATVKVGLTDGTSQEIELGSTNPTNDGIYARKKGEAKVYLVNIYYEDQLKLSRGYFINKAILPVEGKTLKHIAYEKNGVMQFAINITAENAFNIVAPIKEEAEASQIAPMLDAVVKLQIKDIVDENPTDLAKYGLDKPVYSILYGDASTTAKIFFGKDVEKGTVVYAKFPNKNSVFTIDVTPLAFLDVKLSDILDTFIYLTNINDVNKIELSIDGKKIVSDITTVKDKSDEDKFKVDGKDANVKNEKGDSLFRAFYSSMIGITMTKYEPDAKPSGAAPEVSIKYYLKPDSKVVTIDLVPKDSNYYYAMKDGVYTNRVVLKADLDKPDGIRETYKALMKSIDEAK